LPPLQLVPQRPQLASSFCTLTHLPSQIAPPFLHAHCPF
jgi:hypothetical protein